MNFHDWYVDVIRVLRKKIIIFIHIHTKISFAIPIYEIGGIHAIFECFAFLLRDFLYELDRNAIAEQAYNEFNSPKSLINFVKTNHNSTLSYASTCAAYLKRRLTTVTQASLDNAINILNNMPRKSFGYKTPHEIWLQNL